MVSPKQAVAAVRDCAEATSPSGVDADKLLVLGWERAQVGTDAGEDIEIDLVFFGRRGGGALIMTGKADAQTNRVCTITGGLASGFDALLDALSNSFSAAGGKEGDHYFRVGRDLAVASPTGTGQSFRIVVIEPERVK